MIRARDIKKAYRKTTVLRGVSLDVRPGTIHGFVGPNGAGKSTFLKCLVGVVRPDSGTLEIDGVDGRRNSLEVRRRVGYAPAETSLYHRMMAVELRALRLEGFGPGGAEDIPPLAARSSAVSTSTRLPRGSSNMACRSRPPGITRSSATSCLGSYPWCCSSLSGCS